MALMENAGGVCKLCFEEWKRVCRILRGKLHLGLVYDTGISNGMLYESLNGMNCSMPWMGEAACLR